MKKSVLAVLILGVLVLSMSGLVFAQENCNEITGPYIKELCEEECLPLLTGNAQRKCFEEYGDFDKEATTNEKINSILESKKDAMKTCLDNKKFNVYDFTRAEIFSSCVSDTLPLTEEDKTLAEIDKLLVPQTDESDKETASRTTTEESKGGRGGGREVSTVGYPRFELWRVAFNFDKDYIEGLRGLEYIQGLEKSEAITLKPIINAYSAACIFYNEEFGSCIGELNLLEFAKECKVATEFKMDFSVRDWTRDKIKKGLFGTGSNKIIVDLHACRERIPPQGCDQLRLSPSRSKPQEVCNGYGFANSDLYNIHEGSREKTAEYAFRAPTRADRGLVDISLKEVQDGEGLLKVGRVTRLDQELNWQAEQHKVFENSDDILKESKHIQDLFSRLISSESKVRDVEVAREPSLRKEQDNFIVRSGKALIAAPIWLGKTLVYDPVNYVYGQGKKGVNKFIGKEEGPAARVAKSPGTFCGARKLLKFIGAKQCGEAPKQKVTLSQLDVELSPVEQACLISSGWRDGAEEFLTATIEEQVKVFDKISISKDTGCKNIGLIAKLQNMVARYLVLTDDEEKEPGYKSATFEIRRLCKADPAFGNGVKSWKELSDAQQSQCFVKWRVPFIPGKLVLRDSLDVGGGSSGASVTIGGDKKPTETGGTPGSTTTGPGKEIPTSEGKEIVNQPNVAKEYTPEKIGQKAPTGFEAIGQTPSDIYTIGDDNIDKKGNLGGVGIGDGGAPSAVSFSPGSGGVGSSSGGAQVAQAPSGLDVDADVDPDTGDVQVTTTPTGGDIDPDTPIVIDVTDGDGNTDSYQWYPDTDVGAPEAPRSGAEKAAIGILFVLLAVLAVLGWMYYKGRE